jgi:hypothetical protein
MSDRQYDIVVWGATGTDWHHDLCQTATKIVQVTQANYVQSISLFIFQQI